MDGLKVACFIFVYVVVVCPINEVVSVYAKSAGSHHTPYREADHVHKIETPCEVCPRQGECVPHIRCPAHLRPGSFNPECHLDATGGIGICCFTGTHHAAEFELKARHAASIDAAEMKSAHNLSYVRLDDMFRKAEKLLESSRNVLVDDSTPDFGYYLSFISTDAHEATLGRGGMLNLLAAQELRSRQALDQDQLLLGFTEHAGGPYCLLSPPCPSSARYEYRTITGECNHPLHRRWGAANSAYERLLPPDYSDGIWSLRSATSGAPLPSPRTVSATMLPDGNYPSSTHNMLFMQFSQFIAHDVSAAAMFSFGNGSAISCCSPSGSALPPEQQHFACAPISVDPGDGFFGLFGRTCLSFVRAQLAPSEDCSVGYAKPMNSATHYLDLSHLYGKTAAKARELRQGSGLLKTFSDHGRELPPLTDRKECMSIKGGVCFESGDSHGNQIISLTVLHTIFTREHNRLARDLSRLNPDWDDDTLYYETRRLLQAMYQHIVYNEWLPLVIGPNLVRHFNLSPSQGYSSLYNPAINPSIMTEFSTAAMRFGHSSVDGKIVVPHKTGEIFEAVSIPEVMFSPSRLRLRPYLDRLLNGIIAQPMQSVDPFITEALTRYMFHGGSPHGLDLASLNIQRARDFGVRSYNNYRRLAGLPPFVDFNQFPPSASKRLSSVYTSPEDIDLWIGGLLEEAIEGGIVGPTFADIIAEQFLRLKRGDRYYYENGPEVNPGAFSPNQLAEIKKITLARIVCDNKDGIELTSMPPNAFIRADLLENTPIQCDSTDIPTMDLSRFKVI